MNQAKTKIGVIVILSIIVLLVSIFVFAKPDTTLVPATNKKSGVSVVIPAHALQVADDIFSLGQARDVDGRIVEGFLFIDKKKGNAKPLCGNDICEGGEAKKCPADCPGNGGGDPPVSSTCFSLFAKGARWKTTEPYVLNSTNNDGLTDAFVANITEFSLNEWDDEVAFDIFGSRNSTGITNGADKVSPDGNNEVMFENLGADDTIAFTIVWGIFRGKPSERELLEWDVVFNSNYTFGNFDGTGEVMDYQGVGTHEFGHAVGLTHPDDTCTEETMFRFIDFNETKKRDLNAGDISGVNKLYT